MSLSDEVTTPRTFIFDGNGGAVEADANEAINLDKKGEMFWQHLDYQDSNVSRILLESYKLDQTVFAALTDEDTRPRFFEHNGGLVLILRVINHNPGSEPEDMVSLRVWVDNKKIITLAHRHIKAVKEVISTLEKGRGPDSTMQCLLDISDKLTQEIEKAVDEIGEQTTDLEEEVIDIDNLKDFQLRVRLSDLRRQIIAIRRYIAPQKDVFSNLQNSRSELLSPKHRLELREIGNRIIKIVEDLDYSKDHLAISHEELQGKMSISMSHIMYMISIVTMIFLPLSLITGLLGINVKGIPLAEENYAFLLVCLFLIIIGTLLLTLMKKLRWI